MVEQPAASVSTASVLARAALAGNPSDGYRGSVFAVPVPTMGAAVSLVKGDRNVPLVAATLDRFEREVAPVDRSLTLAVDTSIPRSVGLAGSSAIVVAGLRALHQHAEIPVDDARIVRLAHAIEREDLCIAGGWQDQVSQVAGDAVLMDFALTPPDLPTVEVLRPGRAVPFFVAWNEAAAENSSVVHGAPVSGLAVGEPAVARLVELARAAADAFRRGDVHGLKAAMGETLSTRYEVMPIRDEHRRLATDADELGAVVNFTGSGGAVIGVLPKDPTRLLDGLTALGYGVTTWEVR